MILMATWPLRSERAGMATGFDCQADYLGIGVDRLDYTKGIPERFRGIERFLEKHPTYQGVASTHVGKLALPAVPISTAIRT